MRCLRNKIHSNLFLTFILGNTFWIATATMQSLQLGSHGIQVNDSIVASNCRTHIALEMRSAPRGPPLSIM